jgi:EAL domain-containing protein (putative c-di-GMP-specific phosphodiesterase class I)
VEDITDHKIRDMILKTVSQNLSSSKRIIFELTENENIQRFSDVQSFIHEVKAYGCKIAIDDFGSGYSNFEYLAQLHVDYVKIDGSLIRNIDADPTLKIIVRSIVDFARQMNFKTVAEYVHNKQVYEIVTELGVDFSQGYYFGQPVLDISKNTFFQQQKVLV